jgi:phosphinothricin acetyltransferase
MNIAIDALLPQDWESVRVIYIEGMATGLATFETETPAWVEWDAAHLPGCRLAARLGSRLVGWSALSSVSRRMAYAGVAEGSIYIAAAVRGQGVGKALLNALIAVAEQSGFWTLQAVIFAENKPSIALHRGCGFREVGRRERIAMRDGAWHDTIIMERRSRVVGVVLPG